MMRQAWIGVTALAIASVVVVLSLHHHHAQVKVAATRPAEPLWGPPPGMVAIATANDGSLYVDEQEAHRILKVTPARKVTVYAGGHGAAFSGDGGAAEQSALSCPTGIAVDAAGNLFIADTGNQLVRVVNAKTHVISTYLRDAYRGLWNGSIAAYSYGQKGAYPPISIAVGGADSIFIGGVNSMGVRRLDALSGQHQDIVWAGSPGTTSYPVSWNMGPFWLATDAGDEVFFSDITHNAVFFADANTAEVYRVAGGPRCGFGGDGGPAGKGALCSPMGIAVQRTAHGRQLLIADAGNNRVREVDLSTGTLTTIAGNGQAGYSGDGGSAVRAKLNQPTAIAVSSQGKIFILDSGNDAIRLLDPGTGMLTTWISERDLDAATDQNKR